MKKYINLNYIPSFYASFFIGMIALEIGVILPYLMNELSLNYTLAGGIISAFAIGNLAASFANSVLIKRFSSKVIILIFSVLLSISLFAMTFTTSYSILYVLVLIIGIGRGSINIFIYSSASNSTNSNPRYVHLLSVIFAIGALVAPLITSLLISIGLGWRQVIYIFTMLSVFVPILLFTYHTENKVVSDNTKNVVANNEYIKNPGFYILGFILFFYIGLENCVNGWFVQYFKDMNIMSRSYANSLVSITWGFVIIGRLVVTYLVSRIEKRKLILLNCLGAATFFVILIATKNLGVITFSIIGLGFFFAGIYPTCISSCKQILNGSVSGMSLLMAFASLGGILIPQVVGVVADLMGLTTAFLYFILIMVCMITFSIINYYKKFSEN